MRNRLLKSGLDQAALLEMYGRIVAGKRAPDDETNPLCSVIKLSGVARLENGFLRVRNRIYERVFDREWVLTHMPDAEVRRQRKAFRRGLALAGATAGVVLAVVGELAGLAIRNAGRADANAHRAALSAREAAANEKLALANANQAQRDAASAQAAKSLADANARDAEAARAQALLEKRRADAKAQVADVARQHEAGARLAAVQNADLADENAQRADENARSAAESARRAEDQARQVTRQRNAAQRLLYISDMNLVQSSVAKVDRSGFDSRMGSSK